jgi:hypothetical protein
MAGGSSIAKKDRIFDIMRGRNRVDFRLHGMIYFKGLPLLKS